MTRPASLWLPPIRSFLGCKSLASTKQCLLLYDAKDAKRHADTPGFGSGATRQHGPIAALHPCGLTRTRIRPNTRVMAVYPSGCVCRIAVRLRTKSHRMVWNLALIASVWNPSLLIAGIGSETCPKHPGSGVDDGASARLSESNNAYSISGKLESGLGSSNPSN